MKNELAEKIAREIEGVLPCNVNFARREQMVEIIAAHLPSWRPIEEAPKNQKVIVRYLNALGKQRTQVACFYAEGTLECDTEAGWNKEDCWYEETEAYEYLMPLEHEPTHFLLLSDLPKLPEEQP